MIPAANPKALVVPIWSGEGRAIAQWQPSLDAHCLIVGGQDIDRAVTIGELVTRFVDAGYRVWVGGGHQVADAQTWPPRSGDESVVYAVTLHDQIDMLRAAHEKMIARYHASTGGERSRPPLVVVVSDFSVVEGSALAAFFLVDQIWKMAIASARSRRAAVAWQPWARSSLPLSAYLVTTSDPRRLWEAAQPLPPA